MTTEDEVKSVLADQLARVVESAVEVLGVDSVGRPTRTEPSLGPVELGDRKTDRPRVMRRRVSKNRRHAR